MARKKIEDKKVINVWVCPECKDTAEITPDWYQNNGTPMCVNDETGCDCDMEYSHTEIEK